MQQQWKRALSVAMATVAAAGLCTEARADRYGQSFWIPGQMAAFSAMMPNTGFTLTAQPYYYTGDYTAEPAFDSIDLRDGVYDTSTTLFQFAANYAFKDLVAGGRVSVGALWGAGNMDASYQFGGPEGFNRSDSSSGMTDLMPYTNIAWRDGTNNYLLYLTGNLPTGSFEKRNMANMGLGHYSIDVGGGYTYLDRKTGTEASILLGTTYNWGYDDLPYQNGINGHVDFSWSRFVTPHLSLGAVGYGYWQYTKDQYNGEDNGVASSTFALGPQATYVFRVNNLEWTANLRGYYEFASQYRPEGYAIFATLSMPFGGK